jgi:hypothetical protein
MSKDVDRRSALGERTAVSLVAMLACALASDALASVPSVQPGGGERDLATRAAAIVDVVRQTQPALVQTLPPDVKLAQWRNV